MQTDLNDWTARFQEVARLTDRRYVLIVHEDDYWPMLARLIHQPQVRVQSSAFVQKGAAYVVPDPKEYADGVVEGARATGFERSDRVLHPVAVLAERGGEDGGHRE